MQPNKIRAAPARGSRIVGKCPRRSLQRSIRPPKRLRIPPLVRQSYAEARLCPLRPMPPCFGAASSAVRVRVECRAGWAALGSGVFPHTPGAQKTFPFSAAARASPAVRAGRACLRGAPRSASGLLPSVWRSPLASSLAPRGSGKSTLMNILGCFPTPALLVTHFVATTCRGSRKMSSPSCRRFHVALPGTGRALQRGIRVRAVAGEPVRDASTSNPATRPETGLRRRIHDGTRARGAEPSAAAFSSRATRGGVGSGREKWAVAGRHRHCRAGAAALGTFSAARLWNQGSDQYSMVS
jgi:hypothetical protein